MFFVTDPSMSLCVCILFTAGPGCSTVTVCRRWWWWLAERKASSLIISLRDKSNCTVPQLYSHILGRLMWRRHMFLCLSLIFKKRNDILNKTNGDLSWMCHIRLLKSPIPGNPDKSEMTFTCMHELQMKGRILLLAFFIASGIESRLRPV